MHINIKKAFGLENNVYSNLGNNVYSKGNSLSNSEKIVTTKKNSSTWKLIEKQVFDYAFSDKYGLIRKLSIKFILRNSEEIGDYLINNTKLLPILFEVYDIIRYKFDNEELTLELTSDDHSDNKYLILCIISSSPAGEILPKLEIVEDNILELDYDNVDKPIIDVEFQ